MSERSSEEYEIRVPVQAGDEDGTIDQHAGGDGSNDPTPDEQQQPPPP
ncbi:MAG TPA: hypothetical protein VF179_13265 [Thermoanaerobaculia bacterium]|nr:hypothetical protein [Thermoanaerobaculia bacterium]